MAILPKSTLVRFGAELRRFRDQAGLSQSELAARAIISQSTLSDIERGKKATKKDHVARIDDVLSAGGTLLRVWERLVESSGLSSWFRGVAVEEREASQICLYATLLVPGLLQTEEYARSSIRIGQPSYPDSLVEKRVQARMERQSILGPDGSLLLTVIVDESVLRRLIGGREIMNRQLAYLLEMAERPRVTIQVVPMDALPHPGLDGPFQLFTLPDRGDILYTETRSSGEPVDDPTRVRDYMRVFSDLRGAALPESASRDFIAGIIRGENQ